MQDAMRIVWLILGMGAAIAIGRFCWRFFIFGAARSIEKEIRQDMYGHLSTLSMRYFNQHKTGDLMAHFTNDLMAVRQLLGMTVITAFDATVMLVLVLAQMITAVSPKLTALAVLPLLIITVGDFFYGKMMHKRFKQKQEAFSALTDQVQESISGIRVIKAFVQERKELYAFAATTANTKEKNLNVVRLQALMMPVMDMIIGTSTCHILLGDRQIPVPGISGYVKDGIVDGLYAYEAGQSCVGDHFEWCVKNCVPPAYFEEAKEKMVKSNSSGNRR